MINTTHEIIQKQCHFIFVYLRILQNYTAEIWMKREDFPELTHENLSFLWLIGSEKMEVSFRKLQKNLTSTVNVYLNG